MEGTHNVCWQGSSACGLPEINLFCLALRHFLRIPRCLRSAGQGELVVKDSTVTNDQPVVTLTWEHRRYTAGRVARDLELTRLLVYVRFSSLSQQDAILTFFRWRGIDGRGFHFGGRGGSPRDECSISSCAEQHA